MATACFATLSLVRAPDGRSLGNRFANRGRREEGAKMQMVGENGGKGLRIDEHVDQRWKSPRLDDQLPIAVRLGADVAQSSCSLCLLCRIR